MVPRNRLLWFGSLWFSPSSGERLWVINVDAHAGTLNSGVANAEIVSEKNIADRNKQQQHRQQQQQQQQQQQKRQQLLGHSTLQRRRHAEFGPGLPHEGPQDSPRNNYGW